MRILATGVTALPQEELVGTAPSYGWNNEEYLPSSGKTFTVVSGELNLSIFRVKYMLSKQHTRTKQQAGG
jgi:hypothetical protein